MVALQVAVLPATTNARTIEEALLDAFPAGDLPADGAGLAQAFIRTVPASFPITGTSASYVYHFAAATDSFERIDVPLGPVFSERAETLGGRKLSVGLNYVLARYDRINGDDLDNLVSNDPRQSNDYIRACSDTCKKALGVARIDLEAQILGVSATYGLTPRLDVNMLLPLVRTALRVDATFTIPDPRIDPTATPIVLPRNTSAASTGIGDLLLRLKYAVAHTALIDVAAGLSVSIPTGAPADFHGTGDTLLGAALYASHVYAERIEPHINLGLVADADKVDRSSARYSAGADMRVWEWLTLNYDFLGRSDLAQADRISRPVFVQIERADILQLSTGFKVTPFKHAALLFNVLLPLNDDGVRSDHIFTFGAEAVF